MKKRLSGLLSLILLPLVIQTARAETAPQTVNIGYQKGNIFALLKFRGLLDKDFKQQGINVNWIGFTAGPQMLEGLNVGSIDLAATGDAPPVVAQAAGTPLVYLAHSPANPLSEAIVVPQNSAIKTVADLKGKRVALNKGSDVNYLLIAALNKAGLSYRDITPVYLAPGDARAAFQTGSVDAWAIWDPYLAEVETDAHARQITNANGLVPHYTFFLASRKFADTYPQTARKLIAEIKDTSRWANTHQEESATILSKSTGLGKNIWEKTLARETFGADRMTAGVFAEQQVVADSLKSANVLPVAVQVSQATWSADKK
ncbi:aliphatic sulfonate ABC transporter substrate-binding protein [Tatumella sp. JGM118]|uniref:aliphatic sulfonate ABC transporter substrate-binding protein n=1 Tax=Tatumella sp. JGM118 TaxID=2799796 RepID=UPI001BB04573|nr:aliphatic sulfonate ABC transporter substrate-binding protein [Tatumella sp. JGM118]MBS0908036.1 aliphatic sulfonate ABC transporter substrate-binding protein [Tatumella sp. JGM118]